MRTVILFSSVIIAQAINSKWTESEIVLTFTSALIMVAMVMDLIEFIKKIWKS